MWQLALLSLSFFLEVARAKRRACYFPDGTSATDYLACDIDAAAAPDNSEIHSACCALSDNVACLSSNLCYNRFGYIYRGGCTDKSWNDPSCPSKQCTSFEDRSMNILACNDATGFWCCAEGGEVPCCQNENNTQFYLDPGTITFVAEGLSTVSLPVSTSTTEITTIADPVTTSTSNPTATTAPQATATTLSAGAAAGMGIGIGIPTILAILFAALWFLERAKRKRYEQPVVPPPPFAGEHDHWYGAGGPPELHDRSINSELSSGYDGRPVESADIMELSPQTVKPAGRGGGGH